MRKMITAIVISIMIIILSLVERGIVNIAYTEVSEAVNEARNVFDNDSESELENLKAVWKKHEKRLRYITEHDKTDTININMIRMEYYVKANAKSAFEIEAEELLEHLGEIKGKSLMRGDNIF